MRIEKELWHRQVNWQEQRMREKHLPYFEVLHSFNAQECPLCFQIRNRIDRWFGNLLHENVNDPGFRKKFRKNHGFCNYHSYKFLSYNDGLAISLTHRDLVIDMVGELKARSTKYSARKKTNKCIVCELAKKAEVRYTSIIIEYLDDEEFKSKFLSSEGLCIPHYEILLMKMKLLPKWLTDFHIKRYREILAKLDRYLDSCNFSLSNKRSLFTDDEKLIWKKVVGMLFGFEGRLK